MRHHKKTRNTRDIGAEDRKRGIKVKLNGCKFRLAIKHVEEINVWTLEKMQPDHNHAPQSDPFQLFPHRHKDPGRQEAKEVGQSLRAANIPFSQARRTMLAKGISLSKDDYYNLSKSEGRLSEQDQRIYAIASLEPMDFHVRCYERYDVVDDNHQRRVIEHFFFCNNQQILLARRFASEFVIKTDATFNTNALNLPLSSITGITNTSRTFVIAHCFITSESTDCFLFINACLKELFFHDRCPGPQVIVGIFLQDLQQQCCENVG